MEKLIENICGVNRVIGGAAIKNNVKNAGTIRNAFT